MFRQADPDERMKEVTAHLRKLDVGVGGAAYVVVVFFFSDIGSNVFPLQLLVLFLCFVLTALVPIVAWHFAAIWLGKLSFKNGIAALAHPQRFARMIESFAEAWWQNEIVLNVFYSVLRFVCTFGIYLAVRPLIDMVAHDVR